MLELGDDELDPEPYGVGDYDLGEYLQKPAVTPRAILC